jgi:ATP sulfurylase
VHRFYKKKGARQLIKKKNNQYKIKIDTMDLLFSFFCLKLKQKKIASRESKTISISKENIKKSIIKTKYYPPFFVCKKEKKKNKTKGLLIINKV